MKAVVLVGGFGTRLRPLTLGTPKQMLPVVDRPMLEWVLAHLGGHEVTDVVLSLGYRPDAFMDAYPDGVCAGVRLEYAVEDEPLDTAGAIRFAATEAGIDERFLVVNGDVLTDLDVGAMVDRHAATGAAATIHLTPVDDPSRYGVVPTDADGRVEAFIEKPDRETAPSNWINAGTYVCEPEVLERIPAGRAVSIERETFPALVDDGALYAVEQEGYWLDAGTPATYLTAQLDVIDGRRAVRPPAVDPSARVHASAAVERSVVMAGAVVEAGARLSASAVLPGARVGTDAVVEGSIVGPRADVGSGARLADLTMVGDDTTVEPGAELCGARVPDPDAADGADGVDGVEA